MFYERQLIADLDAFRWLLSRLESANGSTIVNTVVFDKHARSETRENTVSCNSSIKAKNSVETAVQALKGEKNAICLAS